MVLSVIKCFFLGNSKSWRASRLHYWIMSYSNFADWVGFAYWWSFSGGGSATNGATMSSLHVISNNIRWLTKLPWSQFFLFNYVSPVFQNLWKYIIFPIFAFFCKTQTPYKISKLQTIGYPAFWIPWYAKSVTCCVGICSSSYHSLTVSRIYLNKFNYFLKNIIIHQNLCIFM